MDDQAKIERIEQEIAELLEEATRIVPATETPGHDDDALILVVLAQVRSLENQLGHLKRRQLHME